MSAEEEDDHIIAVEPELDPEDEPQSWENFQSTTQLRRGEKEFEPDNTEIQQTMLQTSLNHMFTALSASRQHTVKQNVKCFFSETEVLCELKGSFLQTMGIVKGNWCHLTAEEAIYLVERGTVEPYWTTRRNEEDDTIDGNKMDLQSVYALMMEDLSKYQVYANLKRCGYIVLRHDSARERSTEISMVSQRGSQIFQILKSINPVAEIFKRFFRYIGLINYPAYTSSWLSTLFTTHRQITESLQLPFTRHQPSEPLKTPIDITYDVWKPDPSFSKKTPPTPDFQIIAQDVHKDKLPTKVQLEDLFSRALYTGQEDEHIIQELLPRDPVDIQAPKTKSKDKTSKLKGRSQAKRMKEGYNAVLLALVDHGVINYIRVSQGHFEREDIIPKESDYKKKGGKRM